METVRTPKRRGRPPVPLHLRFEEHIEPEPNSGCWLWIGSCHGGYGTTFVNQKPTRANRAAWELYRGPIPEGLFVCHRCDNPRCVNPAHLFLGTCADNVQDMKAKRRHRHGERHHNARTTYALAQEIREAVAAGARQRHVARRLGVSVARACRIVNGQVWAEATNG